MSITDVLRWFNVEFINQNCFPTNFFNLLFMAMCRDCFLNQNALANDF
jgi:hypothetical protein